MDFFHILMNLVFNNLSEQDGEIIQNEKHNKLKKKKMRRWNSVYKKIKIKNYIYMYFQLN